MAGKKSLFSDKKFIRETIVTAIIICVATLSGKLMPLSDGTYIHIGDAIIYAAAMLLPFETAVVSAAIGSAFGDLFMGSFVYIIPTLILKPLTVIAAIRLRRCARSDDVGDFTVGLSGIVTVVGYYIAEVIIGFFTGCGFVGAFGAALPGILFNLIQALAALVVFVIIANSARKRYAKLKKSQAERDARVEERRRRRLEKAKQEQEREEAEDDE